jgi:hypothetical protein
LQRACGASGFSDVCWLIRLRRISQQTSEKPGKMH